MHTAPPPDRREGFFLPGWLFGAALATLVPIATGVIILAYRSGALVDGLDHLATTLSAQAVRLDQHTQQLADHDGRLKLIEGIDHDRQQRAPVVAPAR